MKDGESQREKRHRCTHTPIKKTPFFSLGRAGCSGVRRSTQTTECPGNSIFTFSCSYQQCTRFYLPLNQGSECSDLIQPNAGVSMAVVKEPSSLYYPLCFCTCTYAFRAHPTDFCPERLGMLAHKLSRWIIAHKAYKQSAEWCSAGSIIELVLLSSRSY